MFPLYGPMFVPSLVVTPLVLLIAYVWRRNSGTYHRFWWSAVAVCFLLTVFYGLLVLYTPYYSQQNHSPDNPGGFGKGATLPALLGYLFFAFCLVFPSFPTLLGLAFLPPRSLQGRRRSTLTALIALYVVVLSVLIYNKHLRYMDDYYRARAKPQASPIDRFKHLRNSPTTPKQQEQLQRLQDRIKRRQQQEQGQQPLAIMPYSVAV